MKAAATFGGALAVMGVAPDLKADIIDLSFSPGSVSFQTITSLAVNVQVSGAPVSFQQWNDVIGKTLYAFGGGSIGVVSASQSLGPNTTFFGAMAIGFTAAATGTAYVGFNTGGAVGWFALDLGGAFGAITYLGGQYGSMGEVVHVPAPAGLALLALGAVGIRRKRAA